MKKYFLSGYILLCAVASSAQAVRLVAKSDSAFYSGSYVMKDSTHYAYSFGRALMNEESAERTGVWMANLQWAADEELFITSGVNSVRYQYQYDNDGRLTRSYGAGWNGVAWDTGAVSTYHYTNGTWDTTYVDEWIGVGQPLAPMSREILTYGPDGLLTTELQLWNGTLNTYENERKVTNTYTAGKLTEVLTTMWDGSAYAPYSRREYSYNGDNVDTATNSNYSGGWIYIMRDVYSYDVNNDIVLTDIYGWQNNAWQLQQKRHLTYDNDHNMLTQTEEAWTGSAWENTSKVVHTYTSANFKETQTVLAWDAALGQFVPQQGSGKTIHYYEEFDPSGVNNTVRNNIALQVFPNPANNTISINLYTAHSKPFSITIFDATGRSVKHWNEAPTTFYQKQMDVSQLPSGNYFLRISDRPQEAVQFTIVR